MSCGPLWFVHAGLTMPTPWTTHLCAAGSFGYSGTLRTAAHFPTKCVDVPWHIYPSACASPCMCYQQCVSDYCPC